MAALTSDGDGLQVEHDVEGVFRETDVVSCRR
jgi:hypothetical protein